MDLRASRDLPREIVPVREFEARTFWLQELVVCDAMNYVAANDFGVKVASDYLRETTRSS